MTEQLRITKYDGGVIQLRQDEVARIDRVQARYQPPQQYIQPVQQYQIQPQRQTMSVAEYRMLTDPRIRYSRKESIDPFWNNLGKVGVVLLAFLFCGVVSTMLFAIVVSVVKPEPARVNQNCLAFCGGGNQL